MELPKTRFVIEGDIDTDTALELHAIATERGLRAAAFILPESFGEPTAADDHEASEPTIYAEKHDLAAYADSIGFNRGTAGNIWNMMVDRAFDDPRSSPFHFQDIPTRRFRHNSHTQGDVEITRPIPEMAQGLNVTKVYEWATQHRERLAALASTATVRELEGYISGAFGGMKSFKFLTNFVYTQMGQEGPYDPAKFSTRGRKERDAAIEEKAQRLATGHVVDTEHPMVERVSLVVRYGLPMVRTWGISRSNIEQILSESVEELGITDVGRTAGATFNAYNLHYAQTFEGEHEAYGIREGLLAKLTKLGTSTRTKEVLTAVLSRVLKEAPEDPSA